MDIKELEGIRETLAEMAQHNEQFGDVIAVLSEMPPNGTTQVSPLDLEVIGDAILSLDDALSRLAIQMWVLSASLSLGPDAPLRGNAPGEALTEKIMENRKGWTEAFNDMLRRLSAEMQSEP